MTGYIIFSYEDSGDVQASMNGEKYTLYQRRKLVKNGLKTVNIALASMMF